MLELTREEMLEMARQEFEKFAFDKEELDMWYERFCTVCDVDWKIHRFWLIFDECCDFDYILSRFECGDFGFIGEDEDGLVGL